MIPLWLDCDPGHEDALAMLLACALPHFELIGVSTVFGTAGLDSTTNNALALLTAFHHHHTAVFPGAEKPLSGFMHTGTVIHGRSGLDGTALLPMPLSQRQPDHTAVPAIAEAIEVAQGELAIVATGPLTNIAMLVMHYPQLLVNVRQISIMGGAIHSGSHPHYAEYNIWSDAEAAKIVFSCPELQGKIILVPLNLSHKVLATPDVLRCVQHGPQFDKYTVFRQMMYELLTYFASVYKLKCGFPHGPPVHDVLAVAVLLAVYDDLNLNLDGFRADVEISSKPAGKMEVTREDNGGVYVATHINARALWDLIYNSIAILEGA